VKAPNFKGKIGHAQWSASPSFATQEAKAEPAYCFETMGNTPAAESARVLIAVSITTRMWIS